MEAIAERTAGKDEHPAELTAAEDSNCAAWCNHTEKLVSDGNRVEMTEHFPPVFKSWREMLCHFHPMS